MAEMKTKPTAVSVASYLAAVEPPARRTDGEALCALLERVTGEAPVMWGPSIVGFGLHAYRYESGREGQICRIGFAARKASLVLYGMGVQSNPQALARLGKHTTGKGCLYIKTLGDVDLGVLEAMAATAWTQALAKG